MATIGEGHFGIVDKMICKGTSMAVKVMMGVASGCGLTNMSSLSQCYQIIYNLY